MQSSDPQSSQSGAESVALVLIYKKGCAKTLNFDEARLMNKTDFKSLSSKLIVKFPNIDPIFMEQAKASCSPDTELTDPCFGGVIYSGTWTVFQAASSESQEDGSGEIVVMLAKPGAKDRYFHYSADPNTIRGHLFLFDVTEEDVQAFINNRLFLSDGTLLPE